MTEWIGVKVQLPDNNEAVRFISNWQEYQGTFDKKINAFYGKDKNGNPTDMFFVKEVMCWQPLPKPPEEENE